MTDTRGIIFNSVSQFVEQVGRRQIWKYAELDQMICVWVGPASGAVTFKPKINSAHPDYPLMFCTDSSINLGEALTAEVQVTYQGIILSNGQTPYITDPVTTESPVQGSRDFTILDGYSQVVYYQGVNPSQTGQVATTQYVTDVGTRSVTVRYTGTQCSIKYQAIPRPTKLNYSSLGLSRVKWAVLSTTRGVYNPIAYGVTQAYLAQLQRQYIAAPPPLFAANLGFEIDQKGKWYDCVETYGPTF